MYPLNLVTNSYTSGAQNAAIMVQSKFMVAQVSREKGELVVPANVVHPVSHRQVLKLAVAIDDANCTHMIPLGKEQFEDHPAVFFQPFRFGLNDHSFGDGRDARGEQFLASFDFHQAHSASADVGDSVKVTQRWYVNAGVARGLQDRFVRSRGD